MTKMPSSMSAPSVARGAGNPKANGGSVTEVAVDVGRMPRNSKGAPIQGASLSIPTSKMPRRSGGAPNVIPS